MTKIQITHDKRVEDRITLPPPNTYRRNQSLEAATADFITKSRKTIQKILLGHDLRKIVAIGPDLLHSEEQAMLVAKEIKKLQPKVEDTMFLVMVANFETTRTKADGFKGVIDDPDLNQTYKSSKGLGVARGILNAINEMGVPCGSEILSQIPMERYGGGLLSWGYIGPENTASQNHQEWTSSLSFPVGFHNDITGYPDAAIHAAMIAKEKCHFFGNNEYGVSSVVFSKGNPLCHIIMSGGENPNYSPNEIRDAETKMIEKGLHPSIIIDCANGNSGNKHDNQCYAFITSIRQIVEEGNSVIKGLHLACNIEEGVQEFAYGKTNAKDLSPLKSITKPCISAETAKKLILSGNKELLTFNKMLKAG